MAIGLLYDSVGAGTVAVAVGAGLAALVASGFNGFPEWRDARHRPAAGGMVLAAGGGIAVALGLLARGALGG